MSIDKVTLLSSSLKQWQEEDLEYLRYQYTITPGMRLLDIGAYKHEWGGYFEARGASVEYFEALDNRAAWTHDGTIELGGAYYYSSAFTDGPKVTCTCVDIKPYLVDVELCKINIEGMEYALLDYMMPLISNINHLQVQFHLIDGVNTDGLYAHIAKQLSLTHKLDWRYPYCWESWSRI